MAQPSISKLIFASGSLLLIEFALQKPPDAYLLWTKLALTTQPGMTVATLALVSLRLICLYFVAANLFLVAAEITRRVFLKNRNWRIPRFSLCLILYFFVVVFVGEKFPGVASLYRIPLPPVILCLSVSVWWWSRKKPRSVDTLAPLPGGRQVMAMLIAVVVIFATRMSWKESTSRGAPALKKSTLPNFALLVFDSIPGDYFRQGQGASAVAPIWQKRWKDQAINFTNAYSTSNSTYTSWYALLSGQYPSRSGESLLLRSAGTKEIHPILISEKLKAVGYQTAFLTDCSSTLAMGEHDGFDERIQPGRGIFPCGTGYLLSAHPLVNFFNWGHRENILFPEVDSACSASYRPEVFFNKVEATVAEFQRGPQPYFIAVHSCLTSASFFGALSPPERYQSEGLSESSPIMQDFLGSIRKADFYLDRLLSHLDRSHTWTFFLADHGVRIFNDAKGRVIGLGHGVGDPVSRFQYNVPLSIWPALSQKMATSGAFRPQPISLVDIPATLVALAGLNGNDLDGVPLARNDPPRARHRLIPLISALPSLSHLIPPISMSQIYHGVQIDSRGDGHFDPNTEKLLVAQGARALLDFPYRLVSQPGGKTLLFREDLDPHNLTDISTQFPEIRKKLQADFSRRLYPKR